MGGVRWGGEGFADEMEQGSPLSHSVRTTVNTTGVVIVTKRPSPLKPRIKILERWDRSKMIV